VATILFLSSTKILVLLNLIRFHCDFGVNYYFYQSLNQVYSSDITKELNCLIISNAKKHGLIDRFLYVKFNMAATVITHIVYGWHMPHTFKFSID